MYELRRARLTDEPGVWALVERFATSYVPRRERFAHVYAEVLRDPGMLAFVAVNRAAVIGYLLANRHPTFFANGPVVWVEEVMVDEAMRRRGVGRSLMEAAEAWAGEHDAAYVALATRRASGFYAALGYEESAAFHRKAPEAAS